MMSICLTDKELQYITESLLLSRRCYTKQEQYDDITELHDRLTDRVSREKKFPKKRG